MSDESSGPDLNYIAVQNALRDRGAEGVTDGFLAELLGKSVTSEARKGYVDRVRADLEVEGYAFAQEGEGADAVYRVTKGVSDSRIESVGPQPTMSGLPGLTDALREEIEQEGYVELRGDQIADFERRFPAEYRREDREDGTARFYRMPAAETAAPVAPTAPEAPAVEAAPEVPAPVSGAATPAIDEAIYTAMLELKKASFDEHGGFSRVNSLKFLGEKGVPEEQRELYWNRYVGELIAREPAATPVAPAVEPFPATPAEAEPAELPPLDGEILAYIGSKSGTHSGPFHTAVLYDMGQRGFEKAHVAEALERLMSEGYIQDSWLGGYRLGLGPEEARAAETDSAYEPGKALDELFGKGAEEKAEEPAPRTAGADRGRELPVKAPPASGDDADELPPLDGEVMAYISSGGMTRGGDIVSDLEIRGYDAGKARAALERLTDEGYIHKSLGMYKIGPAAMPHPVILLPEEPRREAEIDLGQPRPAPADDDIIVDEPAAIGAGVPPIPPVGDGGAGAPPGGDDGAGAAAGGAAAPPALPAPGGAGAAAGPGHFRRNLHRYLIGASLGVAAIAGTCIATREPYKAPSTVVTGTAGVATGTAGSGVATGTTGSGAGAGAQSGSAGSAGAGAGGSGSGAQAAGAAQSSGPKVYNPGADQYVFPTNRLLTVTGVRGYNMSNSETGAFSPDSFVRAEMFFDKDKDGLQDADEDTYVAHVHPSDATQAKLLGTLANFKYVQGAPGWNAFISDQPTPSGMIAGDSSARRYAIHVVKEGDGTQAMRFIGGERMLFSESLDPKDFQQPPSLKPAPRGK